MAQNLRRVFLDKLDEIRDGDNSYCTIRWSDTKQYEIISQEYLRLPPSEQVQVEVTYTVVMHGTKRYATVLAFGSKQHCQSILHKYSNEKESSNKNVDFIDDLILMKILGKLLNNIKEDNTGNTHDAQCSTCGMKPIENLDRYHCLICSTSQLSYDLCGRCFEKRLLNHKHLNGHPMIHFKLPNEYLGIIVYDIKDVYLNEIRKLRTLIDERHDGIKCDGICNQSNIKGLRFKCDTCHNYNLCDPCALIKQITTKNHQSDHPIILTSNRNIPKIDHNDIELGQILGRGGFGYVCVATWKSRRREVACKIIEIPKNSESISDLERSFIDEIAAYRELSGPYIVRSYAYAKCDLPATRIHGPKTQLMILMELMGKGSLQNLLDKEPNQLSLRRKLSMSRQIASGMRRIHQHQMIHRDIRPDNVLITDDYIAKIGDMGIARVMDPNGKQSQIGCLQFMPPEFFKPSHDGFIKYDQKLDIFTFGLTLNQLFTETIHDAKFNSSGSRIILKKQSPIFFDDIITKCLDDDPNRRPNAVLIEKTLEMYEQAFSQTMLTDSYARMNSKEKDQVFLLFYQKNQPIMNKFLNEQLPQQFPKQIPIEQKQLSTSNADPCRIA